MEVQSKALNKGEIFCCSQKKVKEIFKNTSIKLNFASTGREFTTNYEHPMYNYARKKIKGKVIAYILMGIREEKPLFNFYILKETDINDESKKMFEEKYLRKFYDFYMLHLNDKQPARMTSFFMGIELYENKLICHEATF